MLIDCRCPFCDSIVRGREEVSIVKSSAEHEKVTKCPRCKKGIKLVTDKPDDLGCISYTNTEPFPWDVEAAAS